MFSSKLLLCMLFLIGIVACSVTNKRSGSAGFLSISNLKSQSGYEFRVMHALQESDWPAWNASRSSLLDFINYWEIRGIRLGDTKLSVVVMPDPKISKSEALAQLYGNELMSSVPEYKLKLEISKTIKEIRSVAQEAFCRFPPLLAKHVALAETDNFPRAQEKALSDLSVFADVATAKLPGFRFDHAYAGYIPEAKCGALVLGRSSDLSKKYDSFGAPDVVQHEMGHIFHDLIWYAQGMTSYSQKSTSLSEAVADVFALSFSGDYCIGKLPSINPKNGEKCIRVMNQHSKSLRQSVFEETDDGHNNNEALRHFLWNLRSEIGQERFAPAFLVALRDVTKFLRANNASRESVPSYDYFAWIVANVRRNLSPMEGFIKEICAHLSQTRACTSLDEFLGEEVNQKLARLEANAPSKSLGIWRTQIVDQNAVSFRFVFDDERRSMKMEVRDATGNVVSFNDNGKVDSVEALNLRFYNAASLKYALWSEYGTLTFQ